MKLNHYAKNSWEEKTTTAPIPHTELLSLQELAQKTGSNLDLMLRNLNIAGFAGATPDIIVGVLAHHNNISPAQLFTIAVGNPNPIAASENSHGTGQGYGQMTLIQICENKGVSIV